MKRQENWIQNERHKKKLSTCRSRAYYVSAGQKFWWRFLTTMTSLSVDSDCPLLVAIIHFGCKFSLNAVSPSFAKAGLQKEDWSPPTEGRHHPQVVLTDFQTLCENVKSCFDSASLFDMMS